MLALLALLIGVIAGLRAMMAPAAVAFAAYLGWLDLSASWLSFLSSIWSVAILSILALGELVTDQLPATPRRTVPQQFGARLLLGGIAGAAILLPSGGWMAGALAGLVGAVIGTLGGAAVRGKLAAHFGRDPPAAFLEDAIAFAGAALVLYALSLPNNLPGTP
jgi:uncharacterized membrane protein